MLKSNQLIHISLFTNNGQSITQREDYFLHSFIMCHQFVESLNTDGLIVVVMWLFQHMTIP